MQPPKYPDVEIQLTGKDGNIFAIIGRAIRAMRRADLPDAEISKFRQEVIFSGSYDGALQTVMRWVTAY